MVRPGSGSGPRVDRIKLEGDNGTVAFSSFSVLPPATSLRRSGIWTRCQQEERLPVTQDLEFEVPLEPRIRRFEQTTLSSDFPSYPSPFLSRHESTHPVCERLSFRCTQCARIVQSTIESSDVITSYGIRGFFMVARIGRTLTNAASEFR